MNLGLQEVMSLWALCVMENDVNDKEVPPASAFNIHILESDQSYLITQKTMSQTRRNPFYLLGGPSDPGQGSPRRPF